MSPFEITLWLVAAVPTTALAAYLIARNTRKPAIKDGEFPAVRPPAGSVLVNDEHGHPNISFEKIKRDEAVENIFGKRPMRKHPALGASYTPPVRKPPVYLTPRMLERANIERRRIGKPALNNAGFKNAAASAWDTGRRQPDNSTDWLTYLILYEVFIADHQQSHCGSTGGITIDPEKPYNGQGGEFAGAGASGSWTDDPVSKSIAGGIAVGASAAYIEQQAAGRGEPARDPIADGDLPSGSAMSKFLNDPLSDPNSFKGSSDQDPKYKPGDEVGGYGNSEVRSYQNNPDYAFDEKPAARSEPMPEPAPQSRPDPVVSDSPASYSSSSDSTPSYSAPDSAPSGGGGDGS